MTLEQALIGFATQVTHLGSLGFWSAVLVLFVLAGGPRAAIGRVAAALFMAAVATHLLKMALGVPRPDPASAHIAMPLDGSFPSGHTAQAAAVCWSLLVVAGRCRPGPAALALIVVGLVAWSRVKLGVHRVEDVVAGTALGTVAAIGTSLVARSGGRDRA